MSDDELYELCCRLENVAMCLYLIRRISSIMVEVKADSDNVETSQFEDSFEDPCDYFTYESNKYFSDNEE